MYSKELEVENAATARHAKTKFRRKVIAENRIDYMQNEYLSICTYLAVNKYFYKFDIKLLLNAKRDECVCVVPWRCHEEL